MTLRQGLSFPRRTFLKGLATAALVPAFSPSILATPAKGGALKMAIGHGSSTDTLDPATYLDYFTGTSFWGTLSNSLTEVDANGKVAPDLAESFETADGAKTWLFKLRKDVEFHNGKKVVPGDVVASMRHHMGEKSKSAAKSILADVIDITPDGDVVKFTLSNGNLDFPFLVSDWHLPIMPANSDGSADWSSGIRTGPYALESFEPGVRARFKRNARYYRPTWFEEVEILSVVDPAARTNALLAGDVDYIDRCDLKTLELLQRNQAVEIDEVTGYAHYMFVMNVTQPPFDNPKVREALKYAIDRQSILDKILLGHGTVGNDNPISPSLSCAFNPVPVHSYNPQKARELLQAAGLDSLKIELSAADAAFSGAVGAAELFKASAEKAGIDITVVREANDAYWDNVWMKKPFVAMYWNGRATCDWMFTTAYAADAAWNETFWKNPQFNSLLVAARQETNPAARQKMYDEMQQLIHDDGGAINFAFNNYVSAHSKHVSHGKLAANWDHDGMKIAQRWWRS
ncbi:MAG: ABC transporter substrate-binding protein [Hyphomicrobiales bacterium]